jgi:MFS family permease
MMPNIVLFSIMLMIVGLSAQTFTTTTNGAVQLWTDAGIRGRVMAIFFAIALGATPLGAPMVGWVADTFGPRWALLVGAASGFAAAATCVWYLVRYRHLRVHVIDRRLRISLDHDVPPDPTAKDRPEP